MSTWKLKSNIHKESIKIKKEPKRTNKNYTNMYEIKKKSKNRRFKKSMKFQEIKKKKQKSANCYLSGIKLKIFKSLVASSFQ